MSSRRLLLTLVGLIVASPLLAAGPVTLPPKDGEAHTTLTREERLFIRQLWPNLPVAGPYQYFNWAPRWVEWLKRGGTATPSEPATADFGLDGEGNVSNDGDFAQAESYIAVDPHDPSHIVAASNDFAGPQRLYSSTDGGATWLTQSMPRGGYQFHSDPGVAYDSRGNAYTVTLGISGGKVVNIVSKSTDQGVTWSQPVELPQNGSEDKELMSVDAQRTSPCRDFVYVAWDTPGRSTSNVKFARSTDGGATFSNPISIDHSSYGIGATLASGPNGEIYVAWHAFAGTGNAHDIRFARSVDCGASFEPSATVAETHQTYDIGLPGFCQRRALIYPSLDVDRSFGCRSGTVYVAWTDSTATGNCSMAGCPSDQACTTDIFVASSSDGGATWSAPIAANESLELVDQFNPWLAVDEMDGSVWVAFEDTRNDPTRIAADAYLVRSTDGGATFSPALRMSAASTAEKGAGATGFQWGDYNGLAAAWGKIFAIWTDRRPDGDATVKDDIYVGRVWADPAGCLVGDLPGGYPVGLD